MPNPFTERGRISEPARFAGRWSELAQLFEQLEQGRPVLIAGAPGVGRSSLLTHVAQSAAAVLEEPELEALYLDLALLPDEASVYRLVCADLSEPGDTLAALEVALLAQGTPVLLCLDSAEAALTAGWGEGLLERLARVARGSATMRRSGLSGTGRSGLLLIAAVRGGAPPFSEPFAVVTLGALAQSEVRLVAEAYLDDTGVTFSPAELHELARLSAGHPAYLQRAAYHLFEHHQRPDYDWQAAYLNEAREQPVVGAPLPPAIFSGGGSARRSESSFGARAGERGRNAPHTMQHVDVHGWLALLAAFVIAIIAFEVSGSWLVGLAVLALGIWAVVTLVRRLGW